MKLKVIDNKPPLQRRLFVKWSLISNYMYLYTFYDRVFIETFVALLTVRYNRYLISSDKVQAPNLRAFIKTSNKF